MHDKYGKPLAVGDAVWVTNASYEPLDKDAPKDVPAVATIRGIYSRSDIQRRPHGERLGDRCGECGGDGDMAEFHHSGGFVLACGCVLEKILGLPDAHDTENEKERENTEVTEGEKVIEHETS